MGAASRRYRRTLCGVVMLALVFAQTLGLVHRIVHSPLALHAATQAVAPAGDWVKALFAGHSTEQGCDLYDQLSHADLIHVDVVTVLPLHFVAADTPSHPASRLAAQATGFLARGPPRTI